MLPKPSNKRFQEFNHVEKYLHVPEYSSTFQTALLTAPWYISISFSPKYGICLKGFTEIKTEPIYVCIQKKLR